jgi:signal peptidase I
MEKEKKKETFWGNVRGLLWAVLIALTIRSLAFEPYNIPSSSMVPSLLVGDYLFITKHDYGYSRHSFPFSIPLVPGHIFAKSPKQGDVVIFKVPTDNRTDYIKRVIGLPGDRIQMVNGRLYINDQLVERQKIGEEDWMTEQGLIHYTRYEEILPNGVRHLIYEQSDTKTTDDTDIFIVPEGYFFAMGDNRDNSLDSRFFGPVPMHNLEGKARFIFYSNNGAGSFWEFWKWGRSLRLERFFKGIK